MDVLTSDLIRLGISFVIIILGAELFTNGVEWLGVRLSLSEGAVGSVLAAVGTALPETLIPAVALLLFHETNSHDIGLGAILGAPFMLATLAFFVTALGALIYRKRRTEGMRLAVNRKVASRDLGFFLPLYAASILISFAPAGHLTRPLLAVGLLAAYGYYVYLNLRESAESTKEEALMFDLIWVASALLHPTADRHALRRRRLDLVQERPPHLPAVLGQVVVALGLIVGGAYAFVAATGSLATMAGFSPLVLALVITPIATELPEKFNSLIWVRQGKDTLALGNITGAMVFQSTFPVTLGLLFTPWHFGGSAAGNAALLSAAIALISALCLLIVVRTGKGSTFATWVLGVGLLWWLAFIGFVLQTVILHRGAAG
jgi:cation:H+ antiporter